MLCPTCQNETAIDKVIESGDTKTYVYICVNPKCSDYLKSYSLDGTTYESSIISQEVK